MDFYQTRSLIQAVRTLAPAKSFLRDRYFPTNSESDIFSTSTVLAEYRDGDKRMAPVVMMGHSGVGVTRPKAYMREIEPCNLAPKRPLSLDEVTKRGFGEALGGERTPEEREAIMAAEDLADLDAMITRREEYIAASVMLDNSCKMEAWGDEAGEAEPYDLCYYEGTANPAAYAVGNKWDSAGAAIFADLAAASSMLTSRGLRATDFVCNPDVAEAIADNEAVMKRLDNRSANFGNLAPVLQDGGAALFGVLNVGGLMLNIITYNQTYQDDDGAIKPYIPSGCGVVTAPGAGHTAYGSVSQVESADGMLHTYAQRRVPKFVPDVAGNSRDLTMTARPVCVPYNANAFISMKCLLTA